LDTLCRYRRAHGLPALAIDWGGIGGAGFVERNQKTAEYLSKVGMSIFPIEQAISILAPLLALDPRQVSAAHVNWQMIPQICPAIAVSPTFADLHRENSSAEAGGTLVARIRAAAPDSRLSVVEQFIAGQVASVFGITADKMDRQTPLAQLGLDSLMAIELKNRIEKDAGIVLPMTEIMHGPNLAQLAQVVLKYVSGDTDAAPQEERAPERPAHEQETAQAAQLLEKIDDLSEAEIDALLTEVEGTMDGAPAATIAVARSERAHRPIG